MAKQRTTERASSRGTSRRAARSEGPRTTLRVPTSLAATADRLAEDLGISRNDALLRLAARGAQLYDEEALIAERREARWAAVVADVPELTLEQLARGEYGFDVSDLPTYEETQAAILQAELAAEAAWDAAEAEADEDRPA